MDRLTINLIGAGRVGRTFLSLLSTVEGCCIQDVQSARYTSAQACVRQVGAGRAVQTVADMRTADLWLISVPDTQISVVASDLAKQVSATTQPVFAFHFSGFFPADEMAVLRKLNWHLGSVHPVLSFADPDRAKEQFPGTLCGLEGDDEAVAFLRPLLDWLGAESFAITSDGKSLYHAAAVFSNNFTVVLQAIAREAWAKAGVPEDVARKLNAKLLGSTAENVKALGPRQALTGPAARGDSHVVATQGRDVGRWWPEAGALYQAMSELARLLKETGSTRTGP